MATLREVRESRFLSLEDLASMADCTKQTIIRAEKGDVISRKTAKHLGRALGLKPDELDGLNYVGRKSVVTNAQQGNH